MTAPGWSRALLRRLAPADRADDVVGDLEEAHRRRVVRRGGLMAAVLTSLETVDVAFALLRERRWVGMSRLDFRLGMRMLVRYPGLTIVGGLALAFAIWIGAGTFEIVTQMVAPRLPLPDGDRIVGLQNWDARTSRVRGQVLHDFATWRDELEAVEDVGAFRTVERNLITGDGSAEPVGVAEISASAFRVTGVPPVAGRGLVEADEAPGAPAVAVIGHDVWQTRFAGDPGIVGRTVRLGREPTTIVGVMPEDYAFPIAQSIWLPLRLNPLDYERGEGPALRVFGRLADGASLEQAQLELATLGARAAAAFPATNEHLRPRLLPYAHSILNLGTRETAALLSSNVLLMLLLVLICSNVALLMFARAATRESEIVVRSALGASRGRIIAQLFAEALVLSALAAAVGLAAAGAGLRWAMSVGQAELLAGARLPFWMHASLSPRTVVYALLLTLLAAAIAGVLPALKVTRGLQARLRAAATGSSMRFGGVGTAIIIAQVAVTVALPSLVWSTRRDIVRIESIDVGFPAEQYLSVRIEMDREASPGTSDATSPAPFLDRLADTYRELEDRLRDDPAVVGVTSGSALPRMYHPHRLIEIDEGGGAPMPPQWPAYRVSSATVEIDFFDVLDIPLLAGRAFHSGDIGLEEDGVGVVLVNEAYVTRVLGERSPIGRRLRYVFRDEDGPPSIDDEPWYEIVGVVANAGLDSHDFDPKVARIYHPARAGGVYPLHAAIHLRGDPESFVPRLRQIALAADPTVRLHDPQPMHRLDDSTLRFLAFWFRLLMAVSLIALLLSLTGIYSVTAFTVARRTREIGIRTALGGHACGIILAIFSRSFIQIALGIAAGAALAGALMSSTTGVISARGIALVAAYSLVMMLVCMLACVLPTWRALRVQPTEAMRAD